MTPLFFWSHCRQVYGAFIKPVRFFDVDYTSQKCILISLDVKEICEMSKTLRSSQNIELVHRSLANWQL